jgi:Arc/MetJ-type ribon-helix-helix transcriptional regulator
MVRTQIQLTEEQAAAVKRIAAQRGVSMAAVIRDAVDEILDGDERRAQWERALSVVGSASGGGGNVSEEHDRYLEEAFLDWRRS